MYCRSFHFILLLLFLSVSSPVFAQFKYSRDGKNVIANRLEGTWQIDDAIASRLNGKAISQKKKNRTFTFVEDRAVLKSIPAKYEEFIGESIFFAGKMKTNFLTLPECPFVLATVNGNSYIIRFRSKSKKKKGDPFGTIELMLVSLALGKTKDNDLLFIGGDYPNEPFLAYQRSKQQENKPSNKQPKNDTGTNKERPLQDKTEVTVKSERKRLAGTWVLIDSDLAGMKFKNQLGSKMVFAGKKVTVIPPPKGVGKRRKENEGECAIDPTQSPKHIDITHVNVYREPKLDGKKPKTVTKVETSKGIYRFEGKRLVLGYPWYSEKRPKSFGEKKDEAVLVMTFERQKKQAKTPGGTKRSATE